VKTQQTETYYRAEQISKAIDVKDTEPEEEQDSNYQTKRRQHTLFFARSHHPPSAHPTKSNNQTHPPQRYWLS
jgi:hypothetical protein